MMPKLRSRISWCVAGTLLAGATPALGQQPRPAAVTDSAVHLGREIYQGSGGCAACHGEGGKGTDSGPALVEGVWLHGSDSFEGILSRVTHGVPRDRSVRDIAMPIRGWSTLDDSQARAVAAYVWVLSHPPARKTRPR